MSKVLWLKWGTVKGWEGLESCDIALLQEYFRDGVPLSTMCDRPTPERKKVLCSLISQFSGEIWSDWDDKLLAKQEAIDYVMGYNNG